MTEVDSEKGEEFIVVSILLYSRSRIPLIRPDSLSIGSSSETDDLSSVSSGSKSSQPLPPMRQQSDADSSTSSDNDTNNKWHNLPKDAWKQASEVNHYY